MTSCKEQADKIRQTIEEGIAGRRDETALLVIAREAATLRCSPDLSVAGHKKVRSVYQWADIYFSPRKHGQWRGALRQVELRLRVELRGLQSSLLREDAAETWPAAGASR
jgi:hypothetical protein